MTVHNANDYKQDFSWNEGRCTQTVTVDVELADKWFVGDIVLYLNEDNEIGLVVAENCDFVNENNESLDWDEKKATDILEDLFTLPLGTEIEFC